MQYKTSFLFVLKEAVKKVLKSGPVGKLVYPLFQRPYRAYAIPMKQRRLKRHGVAALQRVGNVLKANNVEFYEDYGTLLGFIRDNGFIPHDDDIDITIMPGTIKSQRLLKILMDAGFGFIHGFNYKGQLIEFTIADSSQITIDFFFPSRDSKNPNVFNFYIPDWIPEHQYPSEKANDVILTPYIGAKGIQDYNVMGVSVRIPSNYEEVLESEYGPWRVPDPNFQYKDDSKVLKQEGFAYRLTKEEALAL